MGHGNARAALGAAVMDQVFMGATCGLIARRARLLGRADKARGVQQARHAHLGHGFDNARAANAGDARVLDRFVKPRLI